MALLSSLLLISCSVSPVNGPSPENLKEYNISVSDEGSASIGVRLILKDAGSFSVKQLSQPGVDGKQSADIDHVTLVISTNVGDPYNNPIVTPLQVSGNALVKIGGLRRNTTYYIAAKAFEDLGETMNITSGGIATSTETVTIDNDGILSLNNDGGTLNTWDLSLQLVNGAGANLGTNVSLRDGDLGMFALDNMAFNRNMDSYQRAPELSLNQFGEGLGVWRTSEGGMEQVKARHISAFNPDGSEWPVSQNVSATTYKILPVVALTPDGSGFISWAETNLSPSVSQHIYVRHVRNYQPIGGDVKVDGGTPGSGLYQKNSKVAVNDDGSRGIVTWEADIVSGTEKYIQARGFSSADGFDSYGMLGGDAKINDSTGTLPSEPAVSKLNSNGDGLLVWNEAGVIRGRKITVNGDNTITLDAGVGEFGISAAGAAQPSLFIDNVGNGFVVWQQSNTDLDIMARKITNYNVDGAAFTVDDAAGDQASPRIALDNNNDGLIIWQDAQNGNNDIYARLIVASQLTNEQKFRVDNAPGNEQVKPGIALGMDGRGLALWQDKRNGNDDIFGSRFYRQANSVIKAQ